MDKHRCGGWLHPAKVKVRKKMGVYYQNFLVDGYRCDKCGEEIISRTTATEIDRTIKNLKDTWRKWRIPANTRESRQNPEPSVRTSPGILLVDSNHNIQV